VAIYCVDEDLTHVLLSAMQLFYVSLAGLGLGLGLVTAALDYNTGRLSSS